MNLPRLLSSLAVALMAFTLLSCAKPQEGSVKPITGTWVNLAWKDVRNQYTNPQNLDMTNPALWRAKVAEWNEMGLEYLILMEVSNEGTDYYGKEDSPVSVILEEAGQRDMKVFLSTGWAWDQDDDIRKPEIQARQQQIMEELTALYKDSKAFYGWYLPVEDCITPVFPESAVEAVNRLVAKAQELTPGKKTLISPYGMVYADFDNPAFAKNIRSLKVDIIAYQDEVGCVREPFPLPRLKENWKKLAQVHEGTSIEMWANCETFTWEGNTNDRESALIPAAYPRLLAQQIAASEGGVQRIVSFMFQGLIEDPKSEFPLGQPAQAKELYKNYMAWKSGHPYWKLVELAIAGKLDAFRPDSTKWSVFEPGEHSVTVTGNVVRFLDCAKAGILPPSPVIASPNNLHDTWIDVLEVKPGTTLNWNTDHSVWMEIDTIK